METEVRKTRIRLCQHVAIGGAECREPALRGSNFCRHHRRVYVPSLPGYIMEIYPDRESFMRAIQGAAQDFARCTYNDSINRQIMANLNRANTEFARRHREQMEAAKAAKAANFTKKA